MVEEPGNPGKGLMDIPQAMEHQRIDRLTHGEIPQCRVLMGGLINMTCDKKAISRQVDFIRHERIGNWLSVTFDPAGEVMFVTVSPLIPQPFMHLANLNGAHLALR
jgi:hypothetical protein